MTSDATKKRRGRHVASDEAHAWARSLPLNNPNAKTVLRALALYVNGDGSCFVGLDQLSEDTDLSTDTVRRRLVWLEQIGAIVRLAQWLDENGRRNSEGRGKRTSDEIRLLLQADIDDIERRAKGDEAPEDVANSSIESTEISPSTGLGQETGSPAPALGQPSQSCDHLTSEPEPEESPQPPSGGSAGLPDGWKDFETDWSEPILRQSLGQQVWSALKPEEQNLARSAARGYVAWRRSQKKPPNVLGAHIFLKERDAWAEFAKRDPGGRSGIPTGGFAVDSPEANAIRALYAVGRAQPFEHKGRVVYPNEITPQILAFCDIPERSAWLWIEGRAQIKAWSDFIGSHVFGARGALVRYREDHQQSGINAPWPWPPSVDGKIYSADTGPPEPLMTEQDHAEFKA